ncbi:MAG: hypothetical protein ACK53Y_10695, partial [bacterium]
MGRGGAVAGLDGDRAFPALPVARRIRLGLGRDVATASGGQGRQAGRNRGADPAGLRRRPCAEHVSQGRGTGREGHAP